MNIQAFKTTLPINDSVRSLNAAYGGFSFKELSGGRVQPDPAWEAANIVAIPTSDLPAFPPLFGTKPVSKVRLHKKVAEVFVLFWQEAHRLGIAQKLRSFDGAYYPRHKLHDPSLPLSSHSWGIALDFNATTNGYGTPPSRMDIPRDFVALAEQYGMGWGGRWPGSWDGMHFEFVQPAAGADWSIAPVHDVIPPKPGDALPGRLRTGKCRVFGPGNVQLGEGTLVGNKCYVQTPVQVPSNIQRVKSNGGVRMYDAGTNELLGWGNVVGDKIYWLGVLDA